LSEEREVREKAESVKGELEGRLATLNIQLLNAELEQSATRQRLAVLEREKKAEVAGLRWKRIAAAAVSAAQVTQVSQNELSKARSKGSRRRRAKQSKSRTRKITDGNQTKKEII
jgi:hypothetical protein